MISLMYVSLITQKYNKLVHISRRKHTHREQTSGYQWREGKEKRQCSGGGKVQTIQYKIGSRSYYTTQGK